MKCRSLIALTTIALFLLPLPALSQKIEDPDSSPETAALQPGKGIPSSDKFIRVQGAILNKYIVVLNDDLAYELQDVAQRSAQVKELAGELAEVYGGKVDLTYETALKGFSIDLPGDTAAIALSRNKQVKFVEQEGNLQISTVQPAPVWNLDRIDQMDGLNNSYVYNATGAGVTVYVIDTGIRATHQEFGGRASIAADFINEGLVGGSNDFVGHGTHVAGTIGGTTYGVAKGVTIRSVKVCNARGECPTSKVIAGVNFVTNSHYANFGVPAVANMSLGGSKNDVGPAMDLAVTNSINSGVTYSIAAGNSNLDSRTQSPADVFTALTVGSTNIIDMRSSFSNFGPWVDIFAPGEFVVSAWNSSDSAVNNISGTSMASPHVGGAVALYLEGRSGTYECTSYPISGPAYPFGGPISSCPDRVSQFIKSNGTNNRLSSIGAGSWNRLLLTSSLPAPVNPIDNQRFFVWQQYGDTVSFEPDAGGLEFWTGQITNNCGTGFNVNNQCTQTYRALVARAFFDTLYSYALNDNATFVHLCYQTYLRRAVSDSDPGFQFWLNNLNQYGTPANDAGHNALIDAFVNSAEYRLRFGEP